MIRRLSIVWLVIVAALAACVVGRVPASFEPAFTPASSPDAFLGDLQRRTFEWFWDTIAPTAAGGSLPFAPEIVVSALQRCSGANMVRGLCRAGFTGGWLEGRC